MITKMRSYVSLIAVLLVLVTATQALAQTSGSATRANEVEITGTVNAIGVGTVTVGGQVIRTTGAEIKDPITVGAFVKVHLSVAADGSLVARELELAFDAADDFADDELEIVGAVEALTANTVTISGRVIEIARAEIKDTITVGALVKVHLSVAADGTLVAREVELAANANDGDDGAGHDLNDDHGDDGPGHDAEDDHGSDSGDDHSGRGGDDDGGDDHSGHGDHGGDD